MSAIDHNRLIRDAAKRHLSLLGVQQRGRSRTWIDDRGWWLITVEFQPSSWSRGTYLNVGATWLWYFKNYLSFDLGYRIEGFRDLTGEDAQSACDNAAAHPGCSAGCLGSPRTPAIASFVPRCRSSTSAWFQLGTGKR